MSFTSVKALRLMLVIAGAAAILGGCGNNSNNQPAGKGQVVARIGEDVVTTQELENEFRLANVPPDKQKDPESVKKVLGDLVVRKYLFRQAMAAKLDREPGVLLDLLRSREQILENAIVTRRASAKAPGRADVDRYIADNPAKFAGRKLLSVEQIVFPFGPSSQAFVEANKDVKSLDEIDQKLTAAAVPHGRQMSVLNSGDLPPEFYNLLSSKKPDDIFFIRSGANGVFLKVKGEEARPLDGDAAAAAARQLMRAEAIKGETGLAAYSANLEAKYEGEYAKIMQSSGTKKN